MKEPLSHSEVFWPVITISLKNISLEQEKEYINKIKKQFVRYFSVDFDDMKDVSYKENETFVIEVIHGIRKKSVDKMVKQASKFYEKETKIYKRAYHLYLDFLNADVMFIDAHQNVVNLGVMRENKITKKELEKTEKKHIDVILDDNVKVNDNLILHKGTSIRIYE